MFEAKMDNISILRDSISTIADLIDESELHISDDGIRIIATDRTVVVVVNFLLNKNAFSEYKFDKEEKIGINMLTFMQILKRAKPDDNVILRLEDKKLNIILESNTKRNFSLPLIDITKSDVPQLEKIEEGFNAIFEINSDVLSHGIEDSELIGDSVIFTIRKDDFIMNSESDVSSSRLEVKPGDDLKIEKVNEPVRSRYSLDYLKKMVKAKKFAPTSKISMSTDYPMRLLFEIPNKVHLGFILAPRVEEV
ncbi:proliferating cell nuclear antigen (pcna) [Candidatus Aenigmatarchaeota archaeon]